MSCIYKKKKKIADLEHDNDMAMKCGVLIS